MYSNEENDVGSDLESTVCIVIHMTANCLKTYLFQTEDNISDGKYGSGDVIKNPFHLRILKYFGIKFRPELRESLEIRTRFGPIPYL